MSERQHRPSAAGSRVLSLALALLCAALPARAEPDAASVPDTTAVPVYLEEGVVVTASRYGSDVHLSHTDLPAGELRRRQGGLDLPLLLQDVPGVFSYSDAGSGFGYTYLKIRGFDQRRVAVLINGVPQNDPEDHQVYWVNFPDLAASLEDVQVQRGVTNSLGGIAAIGGTVNLVTELLGDAPLGRAALEIGSFGTVRRMLSYQTGELGQGFATGLRLSQQRSDGYRERSGADQWAVFWTGRWRNEAHQVQAHVFTGHELTRHAWNPAPASVLAENRRHNPETYWNAVDDFRQPQYQLHWEWDLREGLQLRQSFYHVRGEGFYENFRDARRADRFGLDTAFGDLYDAGDRVDLVRAKWVRKNQTGWSPTLRWDHPGGRLLVGGDGYLFDSHHWGEVLLAGPGTAGTGLAPDDIPGGLRYYDYAGEKTAWSVYANERWEFTPGLTLLADVQYQRRSYEFRHRAAGNFAGAMRHAFSVDHEFFNPRGGLFWQTPWRIADGDLGIYGHVGLTRREPADSDHWPAYTGPDDLGIEPLFAVGEAVTDAQGDILYTRWSGPRVAPEKVVNYETGLAWRGRTFSLTCNGYWMDFRDEIVPTGWDEERGSLRDRAEKTLHRGVELGLRWRPHRDHRLTLGASRSWSEYVRYFAMNWEGGSDDFSGNPIALFPAALVSATWSSRLAAFACDLRVRHLGRQHLDSTGDRARTIDPSTVVDLTIRYDLGRGGLSALSGMQASVRVLNLLDRKYETTGYFDAWETGENMYIPGAPRSVLAGVDYAF